jgi:hypothetical protein
MVDAWVMELMIERSAYCAGWQPLYRKNQFRPKTWQAGAGADSIQEKIEMYY